MKEIPYKKVGDYFVPDLKLPKQENKPLGRFGRMRLEYIRENVPYLWNSFILNGTLNKHCAEIEMNAERRLEELIEAMAKSNGITEELKASDPIKWAGLMNNIKASAIEIITEEIIFA